MGIRSYHVERDAVKSEHIGPAEVKFGTCTHYTKCTDIDAAFVIFTSDANAALETAVAHPLGRIPQGIIAIKRDKAGVIYAGSGGTAWSTTKVYVHSSVASTSVHALVF